MRVVVVGMGQLGQSILGALERQGHDPVVVDNAADPIRYVEQHHDVGLVHGYGGSAEVLADAGCAKADVVVAVTGMDETNLVVALTAQSLGAKTVIARVQGAAWAGLSGGDGVEVGLLGVDVVFNPRVLAAREMARIARSHGALEVLDIADDRIEAVKLPVAANSRYAGRGLARLQLPKDVKVAAIVRDGDLFVPGGADVLMAHDSIYLMGRKEAIDDIQHHITDQLSAQRVCVLGGGVTGSALARDLARSGAHVMVIEKDPKAARRLAEQLHRVTVVVGDGTNPDLLRQNEVPGYDLFCAVTDDEEVNLLAGLLARKVGVPRVASIVHRGEFLELYQQIGIDIVISPRLLAQDLILRHCRSEQLRSLTVLEAGAAELVELSVPKRARVAGKMLKDVRFPAGTLVCALVKPTGVIVPGGNDRIEEGDVAVVLTTQQAYDALAWQFKPGLF